MGYCLIRKIFAFIKRDFLQTISYRVSFILQFIGIFAHVIIWYFIAQLFHVSTAAHLKEYKGDYFSFILIGIAMTRFFEVGINGFSNKIREEQVNGILETMLSTPTSHMLLAILSTLWDFIFAFICILIYCILGSLFFKANFIYGNFMAAMIAFLLSAISFIGIGIISASTIIVFKRTFAVRALTSYLFQFFGGVYFPITVLPGWLQNLSYLLPITYSLRAIRGALIQGLPWNKLAPDLLALFLFALVLLPLSLASLKYAIRRAKMDGSLTSP